MWSWCIRVIFTFKAGKLSFAKVLRCQVYIEAHYLFLVWYCLRIFDLSLVFKRVAFLILILLDLYTSVTALWLAITCWMCCTQATSICYLIWRDSVQDFLTRTSAPKTYVCSMTIFLCTTRWPSIAQDSLRLKHQRFFNRRASWIYRVRFCFVWRMQNIVHYMNLSR